MRARAGNQNVACPSIGSLDPLAASDGLLLVSVPPPHAAFTRADLIEQPTARSWRIRSDWRPSWSAHRFDAGVRRPFGPGWSDTALARAVPAGRDMVTAPYAGWSSTGEAVVGQQSAPVRTVVQLASATTDADLTRRPDLLPADIAAALRCAAEVPLVDLNDTVALASSCNGRRVCATRIKPAVAAFTIPSSRACFSHCTTCSGTARKLRRHFYGRGIDEGTAAWIDTVIRRIATRYQLAPIERQRVGRGGRSGASPSRAGTYVNLSVLTVR
jgi:hypothetical protein